MQYCNCSEGLKVKFWLLLQPYSNPLWYSEMCCALYPNPRDSEYWQPGETIFVPESPPTLSTSIPRHRTSYYVPPSTEVGDILQCFQSSMEQKLTEILSSMTSIKERMDKLEGRQKSLEDEVRATSSLSSSSVCTPEPNSKVRRRVTPPSLQVCCYSSNNVYM